MASILKTDMKRAIRMLAAQGVNRLFMSRWNASLKQLPERIAFYLGLELPTVADEI